MAATRPRLVAECVPPEGTGEIDQPAGGQRRHHPLLDLLFELLPARLGDGGMGPQ